MEGVNRFFVLGCQRTGTTLLRLVLDSHPDIHCYDESMSYDAYATEAPLPKGALLVGYKMPIWTEIFSSYDNLRERYRGEPILFLLRDVRATVASMKRLGSWLDRTCVDLIETWLADPERDFTLRFQPAVKAAEESPHRLLRLGAIYWTYKTSAFFELHKAGWPVLAVAYDRLVLEPKVELNRVARFLGVNWDDRLLRHHLLPHTETNQTARLAIGSTATDRPIDSHSVDLWKHELSEGQLASILDIGGHLNTRVAEFTNSDAY